MFVLIDENGLAKSVKSERELKQLVTVFPQWRHDLQNHKMQVIQCVNLLSAEEVMEICDG